MREAFDDDQETPDTLVVNYTYPETTIVWEHRLWSTHGVEGRSAAAAFYGDAGTLVVDRGGTLIYCAGAIADFTKAISIDPGAIYGYRMRGRAYYFLNQFDNAMADFEAALRIDPKDSSTISFSNDLKRQQPSR